MVRQSNFRGNDQGAAAPIFAVSLMAIVGLIGATLALGMDSRAANNLQATADAAAIAGATAFIAAQSPRLEDRLFEAENTAKAAAASNAKYFLTNLSIAPLTEDPYGQHTEIEVNLGFSPVNPAANITGRNATVEINRTAVASATWGFPLCILSLAETGIGISTDDHAFLRAQNCIIWSNSTDHSSMRFGGGDAITKFFCAAGRARITGRSHVTPRPHEECRAIPDPLDDWASPLAEAPVVVTNLAVDANVSREQKKLLKELEKALDTPALKPTFKTAKRALDAGELLSTIDVSLITMTIELYKSTGALSMLTYKKLGNNGVFKRGEAKGQTILEVAQVLGILDNIDHDVYRDDRYVDLPTMTLDPGSYAGLDIAYGNVKLNPGIYHIVDAPLVVRRRATLIGEGVTIIFHGDNASFSVLDEARLTLTGPETGETAGFILAEDKRDTTGTTKIYSRITGSGAIHAVGTIYLPSHTLAFKGDGAADQTSPLLQIVANRFEMSDNGALDVIFAPGETSVPVAILPEREARLIR